MFPKRLILAVTTHGMFKCERESIIKTFEMPSDIMLTKLSVSTFGEVNVMDTWQAEDAITLLNAYKRKLSSNTPTIQLLNEIAVNLRKADAKSVNDYLHKYTQELSAALERNSSSSTDITDKINNRDEYADYIRAFNKNYTVEQFSAGDKVFDKVYERTNADVPNDRKNWTILAINMPHNPDILQLLRVQTRHGDSKITLEQLVKELKSQGVQEIVMFDFSCSVVLTPSSEDYVRGRAKRVLRRSSILKKGQYTSRKIKSRRRRRWLKQSLQN